MAAIVANNLVKRFGDLTAVNGLSLSVQEGEIYGFLGQNGAGKTTTIRMLTGVLVPESGSVSIHGIDIHHHPREAKMNLGVIPENSTVYGDMTAEQNLHLSGKMYGMSRMQREKRVDEVLNLLNLSEKRDKMVRSFSKGLRQRLSIGCAIIHQPGILFLDEPTSGLDVQSRRLFIETIHQMNEQGSAIFLTTHNIDEVNTLCDKVCIIKNGKKVAEDRPTQLKKMFDTTQSVEVSFDQEVSLNMVPLDCVIRKESSGGRWCLYTEDPDQVIRSIVRFAEDRSVRILSLSTSGPSLEEAFVQLTGCN